MNAVQRILFLALCGVLWAAIAHAAPYGTGQLFTATVSNLLQSAEYTYVECVYGTEVRWLRNLRDDRIRVGDTIRFTDSAALHNVRFPDLGRSFGSITLTDFEVVEEAVTTQEYRAVDRDGTVIFTDNPQRIPSKKKRK